MKRLVAPLEFVSMKPLQAPNFISNRELLLESTFSIRFPAIFQVPCGTEAGVRLRETGRTEATVVFARCEGVKVVRGGVGPKGSVVGDLDAWREVHLARN